MYTIIRFAFCIIAAIAVLALCKPVRKWFFALNRGLKLILFVGFCGILPLVLLCVSPESDLVRFKTPEAAYHYLNGHAYDDIICGADSALALAVTQEGVVSTTLLHGQEAEWYISKPSQSTFSASAAIGEICIDRLSIPEITGSYWSVMDVWGEIGAERSVALNGVAPAFQTSVTFQATGSEGQYWFFYLEDAPTEVQLTVDGEDFGNAEVRE